MIENDHAIKNQFAYSKACNYELDEEHYLYNIENNADDLEMSIKYHQQGYEFQLNSSKVVIIFGQN